MKNAIFNSYVKLPEGKETGCLMKISEGRSFTWCGMGSELLGPLKCPEMSWTRCEAVPVFARWHDLDGLQGQGVLLKAGDDRGQGMVGIGTDRMCSTRLSWTLLANFIVRSSRIIQEQLQYLNWDPKFDIICRNQRHFYVDIHGVMENRDLCEGDILKLAHEILVKLAALETHFSTIVQGYPVWHWLAHPSILVSPTSGYCKSSL